MPSPARHLSGAAELLQVFNRESHAPHGDWEFPGASYRALGALASLVGRLPQTIEQSVCPVTHTHKMGRVVIDGGGDADQAVAHMREALDTAVQVAALLDQAVQHLHASTSAMGLNTKGLPGFGDDDQ